MINGFILTSGIVSAILFFLFYCLVTSFSDVKFAFLNLFRHKRRSLSIIAAMILGGVAIFIYGGFIDYSFWILKEQTVRSNVGHLQIYHQAYFDSANKNKSIIDNYAALKENILQDTELSSYIDTISGQLEFSGIVSQYENETSSYFAAIGIEPLPAIKLGAFDQLISGSDLSRVRLDEVILGSGLAKTLQAQYGDWLDTLVINSQGGQGALSLKLRGIFESGIKDYDDVAMKIPLQTAQHIIDTNGVSKLVILLHNEDDLAVFSQKLQTYLAERKLPLIVKNWQALSLFYQQVEGLLSGIYLFIKIMVALIVVFMISNAMTMNIIERTREITTLRAIGLKPSHVTKLFMLEGIFIGLIGAVGSLIVGFMVAGLINLKGIAMPPSPGQTHGYIAFIKTDNMNLVFITFVLPVLTTSLAAILPAIRAAKLNISDAFKFV